MSSDHIGTVLHCILLIGWRKIQTEREGYYTSYFQGAQPPLSQSRCLPAISNLVHFVPGMPVMSRGSRRTRPAIMYIKSTLVVPFHSIP